MASHQDPKLLYAIQGIKAYHIQDGEEQSLTPSGPQTLSLLMVPTNYPPSDLSTTIPHNEVPDEDFYLHLTLPPELDLPMPATTQIYHQPPSSYLIPRWDMGPDAGAFTKIEFPRIGYGVTQEHVDTFETILAQCTAFLERAKPPVPTRPGEKAQYNPADYGPGGRYADSKDGHLPGQIVLVDEDDGSVVGELGGDAQVIEDSQLKMGTKDPVEVEVSPDGKHISVRPVSEEYLRMARHPAYKDSRMVQTAASASRLIVTGSSSLGNMLTTRAENFTKTTAPNAKPLEFSPAAHANVRRINTFTSSAAGLTSKTVGRVTDLAQNTAASMSGHRKDRARKGYDVSGQPLSHEEYKPGLLNKGMIAFSTVMDGISTSGKQLLTTGGVAASTVVGHKYGEQAGSLTGDLAGGVKNVGLVYIDVTGVSRRAVIKSVAKGMVVGKVRGGGEVVVGGGDGGVLTGEEKLMFAQQQQQQQQQQQSQGKGPGFAPAQGEYRPEYAASGAPPPGYQDFAGKR